MHILYVIQFLAKKKKGDRGKRGGKVREERVREIPGLSERLARSRYMERVMVQSHVAERVNPSELGSCLGHLLCAGPSRCFKGRKYLS